MTPLYAAAVAAKNAAYDRGWVHAKTLRWPVVSIGNLSVGGSGKTPLTIRVAELLRERGVAVDVLSRGYGRRSAAVERVNPKGTAESFGDEPLEITRATGVPVYVGPSRYAAGLLAEGSAPGPGLHLLDDGFQHRQLARDVDIVVLHRSDFGGRLLPAGWLREGFASLRRAQILALREEDADLESILRGRGLEQPIWWMERRLEVAGEQRVVAFCAIARPEEFFSGLRSSGVQIAAMRAWRDHHLVHAGRYCGSHRAAPAARGRSVRDDGEGPRATDARVCCACWRARLRSRWRGCGCGCVTRRPSSNSSVLCCRSSSQEPQGSGLKA